MQQSLEISDYLIRFGLPISEMPHLSQEKFFKKQSTPIETVLITRLLKKINKRNREQDRYLMISNEYLYNLAGKAIKRKIPLHRLYAVTVSRISSEFILHIPEEYDYRYKSGEYRDLILYYLCIALKLSGYEGLKIYMINDEDLSPYTMNEKIGSDKKYSLHPKSQLILMTPDNFQLQYINQLNLQTNSKTQVLFVRNPTLLRVSLADFPKTVIIGNGSLCKIYLISQKKPIPTHLALKTLSRKQYDIDFDLMEFLLKTYVVEPFITPLELCIQQQDKLHFFFKFMKGGDLYQHLREINNFNEIQAKFIFSQIAMGLSSLHERGIIFGDLKPENVLIDERGYVALTDFGYGKLRIYHEFKKNKQINFTLEYCAPEYLKGELTRMADWYSLGVLLYELLIGIPPFYHPTNRQITINMIQRGQLHFPRNMQCTPECKDMIAKLMQQDTSQRLGFSSDFKEIQAHPWLNDIDWNDLKAKRIELPYIPNVGEQSINESYFNMEQLSEDDRNW